MVRKLLTDEQVAERWGLKVQTLRNWRFQGRGPAYLKLGAAVRYDESVIEEHEKSATVQPRI